MIIRLAGDDHPAPPGHPENADRLGPTVDALSTDEFRDTITELDLTDHGTEPIARIHSSDYISRVERLCRQGGGRPDPDTYISTGSYRAAVTATGCACSAVDAAFDSGPRKSLVMARPPGHHAERDHAMGFCLFNNVAIAAQYALDHYAVSKIAVVDFDVHHGNGTQHAFYDRDDILFISSHQYPSYPGTGAAHETGRDRGDGFTLNLPLPAGTDDADYEKVIRDRIEPALHEFKPEVLFVSAGFDAHRLDPLAGISLTGLTYRRLGHTLTRIADQYCSGRLISLVEGGYSPEGNRDGITNYVKGMTSPDE